MLKAAESCAVQGSVMMRSRTQSEILVYQSRHFTSAKHWEQRWAMHPQAFGRNLKLGVIEDAGSRDQLAPLLRFPTSKSGEDMTGLDDYVSRCRCTSHAHTSACCTCPAMRQSNMRISRSCLLSLQHGQSVCWASTPSCPFPASTLTHGKMLTLNRCLTRQDEGRAGVDLLHGRGL